MKTKTNKEILKELVDSLDEKDIKEVLSRFSKKNKEDYKKRASDFMFETFKETKFSIFDEKDIILYNTEKD
jgi:isopropylmalate/homocitrate/citramalate synthase